MSRMVVLAVLFGVEFPFASMRQSYDFCDTLLPRLIYSVAGREPKVPYAGVDSCFQLCYGTGSIHKAVGLHATHPHMTCERVHPWHPGGHDDFSQSILAI